MKDDTRQMNNTGFPNGTGAPYYMEMSTLSALVKNFEKKKIQSVRFHVPKTSYLYI